MNINLRPDIISPPLLKDHYMQHYQQYRHKEVNTRWLCTIGDSRVSLPHISTSNRMPKRRLPRKQPRNTGMTWIRTSISIFPIGMPTLIGGFKLVANLLYKRLSHPKHGVFITKDIYGEVLLFYNRDNRDASN